MVSFGIIMRVGVNFAWTPFSNFHKLVQDGLSLDIIQDYKPAKQNYILRSVLVFFP